MDAAAAGRTMGGRTDRRPTGWDVASAVIYVPMVVLYSGQRDPVANTIDYSHLAPGLPVLVLVALVLAFRRAAAVPALVVAVGAEWHLRASDVTAEPFGAALVLSTVARTRGRAATWCLWGAVMAAVVASVPAAGRSVPGAEVMALVITLATVLGTAQRRLDERSRAAEEYERTLRALASVEAERARRTELARSIHDLVSGSLGVTLRLAQVARQGSAAEAAIVLERIEEASRSAIRSTRELLAFLRSGEHVTPEVLAAREGVDDLVAVARAAGLRSTVHGHLPADLPAPTRRLLWTVAREGVINVLKHAAAATRVEVRFCARPGHVLVSVHDDAPARAPAREATTGLSVDALSTLTVPGHGLAGLRERVVSLGGSLTASRGPDGWTLEACLPRPSSSSVTRQDHADGPGLPPPPSTHRDASAPTSGGAVS